MTSLQIILGSLGFHMCGVFLFVFLNKTSVQQNVSFTKKLAFHEHEGEEMKTDYYMVGELFLQRKAVGDHVDHHSCFSSLTAL